MAAVEEKANCIAISAIRGKEPHRNRIQLANPAVAIAAVNRAGGAEIRKWSPLIIAD
jgi:hypothetical protein